MNDLRRQLVAEGLGTAILAATIVGSGIVAERAADDATVALLASTISIGAMLVVLLTIFGPVSGAHLNPLVTWVFALRKEMEAHVATSYVIAQCVGGLLGVLLAHEMLDLPPVQLSGAAHAGVSLQILEAATAFGFVLTILVAARYRPAAVPLAAALYIAVTYALTGSSLANPAVALARAFSDTFVGIRLVDVPGLLAADGLGALMALMFVSWLFPDARRIGWRRDL